MENANKREIFVMLVAYGLMKLLRVDIIMITHAQMNDIMDEYYKNAFDKIINRK